jgi:hypothetical protein
MGRSLWTPVRRRMVVGHCLVGEWCWICILRVPGPRNQPLSARGRAWTRLQGRRRIDCHLAGLGRGDGCGGSRWNVWRVSVETVSSRELDFSSAELKMVSLPSVNPVLMVVGGTFVREKTSPDICLGCPHSVDRCLWAGTSPGWRKKCRGWKLWSPTNGIVT